MHRTGSYGLAAGGSAATSARAYSYLWRFS
jgi:hypothetical protein